MPFMQANILDLIMEPLFYLSYVFDTSRFSKVIPEFKKV